MAFVPTKHGDAGLLRRLGALVYDALLVIALLMVTTALFLPLTRGEAITPGSSGWLEYLYQVALLVVIVGFFGIFWTRGGQTLGMMAWRLKVLREDGGALTWTDTVKRLAAAWLSAAVLGLGYLWVLVDAQHRAWHDRLSHTRVVSIPKEKKNSIKAAAQDASVD